MSSKEIVPEPVIVVEADAGTERSISLASATSPESVPFAVNVADEPFKVIVLVEPPEAAKVLETVRSPFTPRLLFNDLVDEPAITR